MTEGAATMRRGIENREEALRPWMAVGVVSLLGPGAPVKSIQNWTHRNLIDNLEQPSEKSAPRIYSAANAIQIHCINAAVKSYTTLDIAVKASKICLSRFFERLESGEFNELGLPDSDDYDDRPHKFMLYWPHNVFLNVGARRGDTPSESTRSIFYDDNELIETLQKTGFLTPREAYAQSYQINILPVDEIISHVLCNYADVTDDFNEKALSGKFKPFPTELK